MLSIFAPILEPLWVVLSVLELGPHGEKALGRVRVQSKEVDRAEETPVS